MASITPAQIPANIVGAGESLPYNLSASHLDMRWLPTLGSRKSSLIESYDMNLTPAFIPLPAIRAAEPA
jgi:hypothetical protein